MDFDQLALDIAGRIADGDPVDWSIVQEQDGRRRLPLRPLQLLEAVHEAFRTRTLPRSS